MDCSVAGALYAEVKKASDSYLGIPSQCMALESCRILTQPPSDQYCANLAMKINAKLGGVNAALADRPAWQQGTSFMVFGASGMLVRLGIACAMMYASGFVGDESLQAAIRTASRHLNGDEMSVDSRIG